MRIALAGNPNAGKTTLFNALCGTNAHTGNYAGVTVERREAPLLAGSGDGQAGEARPILVDLPGCYSLTARSADEDVAQRVLLGDLGAPPCDVVVCVLDALQLARGLYLVLQLRELGIPSLVVLNMADVAAQRGLHVDGAALQAQLGVPVYSCAARRGEGVAAIAAALAQLATDLGRTGTGGAAAAPTQRDATDAARAAHAALAGPAAPEVRAPHAQALPAFPIELHAQERAILDPLAQLLVQEGHPHAPNALGLALWLVTSRLETLRLTLSAPLRAALADAQARLNDGAQGSFNRRIINARFAEVDALVRAVQSCPLPPNPKTRAIDDVLLHPVWGSAIFVATMFVLFQAVFAWAAPMMAAAGEVVGTLAEALGRVLPAGHFRSLLLDGVLVGMGNVLTFVPQIAFLFFGLGLLEESGYMARAACLLDRAMRRVGLSGRAFIPLMSSFACAIPGIMAARTMEGRADRLRTMLVAPLMSCSARLPVYALVIAATFAHVPPVGGVLNVGGLLILAMYLTGFVAALGTAWLLRRTAVPGPVPRLLLELPDYRWPRLGSVARQTARQCAAFLRGSGGTIVALSVLLWAALQFPKSTPPSAEALWASRVQVQAGATGATDATGATALQGPTPAQADALARAWQLEHSAAGRLGKLIEPALAPLGFDWRIGVGIIASFAAREVLVSTLAQIYALDAPAEAIAEGAPVPTHPQQLSQVLAQQRDVNGRPTFTPLVGISLMVFFVLALQCSSTVAVLRRETGDWRWPVAAVAYMNGLAWTASFVVYQGGRALGFG